MDKVNAAGLVQVLEIALTYADRLVDAGYKNEALNGRDLVESERWLLTAWIISREINASLFIQDCISSALKYSQQAQDYYDKFQGVYVYEMRKEIKLAIFKIGV